MILEPLNRLKKADARINMTQGVLEEVGMLYLVFNFYEVWIKK